MRISGSQSLQLPSKTVSLDLQPVLALFSTAFIHLRGGITILLYCSHQQLNPNPNPNIHITTLYVTASNFVPEYTVK